jgi:predicted Zn finger-like uncharacterized protein
MSISVTCSKCSASFRVKDEHAGKRGKCPRCHESFTVPETAEPSPENGATLGRKSVPSPDRAKPMSAAASMPQPAAEPPVEPQAADRPIPPISEDELLAAFLGDIERVRSTWGYRLALVVVGVVMVLLPVIYAGMICLVIYGMCLHAVYDLWVFRSAQGHAVIAAVIFYVGVLIAGLLAVLFMIKPFFARSVQVERRRSLTENGEPLLFAFVDRICDAVGSQCPRRIDVDCQVNASASFRRGFWSMIVGGDMVLTIGLSLTAGMSIQQFAGVLAHEFGHFSQGLGMRMSYLIRTISFWFRRVVYDRDQWDQRLIDWSENGDGRIGAVLLVARFLIWCSRRVLWVLMFIGHAVSGYLLRQMEFDADRYETRLCGSESFEQSTRRLAVLSIAYQGALSDLNEFHREGRLGDNLPRLVVINEREISVDIRQKIDKMVDESTTGAFDTHPCDNDRIVRARRECASGVFHESRPATALFSNFNELAKNTTWDFYRGVFGSQFRAIDTHPIDELLARQGRDVKSRKAIHRFFQGAFSSLRMLSLPNDIPRPEHVKPRAAVAELKKSRTQMLEAAAAVKELLKTYAMHDSRLMEVEMAESLFASNLRVHSKTFSVPLANASQSDKVSTAATAGQKAISKQLEPFETAASRRIVAALSLLRVPQVAKRMKDAEVRWVEAERLLPVLSLLRQLLDPILVLRNNNAALGMLVAQLESNKQNAALLQTIQMQMQTVTGQIREISEKLSDYRYPLDHSKGNNYTIAMYAIDELPCCDDLPAILGAGGQMLDNLTTLYMRICGRLASTVESVETLVGLPLLPEPR